MKKVLILIATVAIAGACVTQKKRGDVGKAKKFYHDITAEFNGYFNATELYKGAVFALEEQHSDNYNKVLPMYAYSAAENPKTVAADMDEAIKKVTVVRALHEPSHWIDDCYLLAAKAQYLKQDYESAEETLEYMMEAFGPKAKLDKRKKDPKQARAERATEKKKQQQEKEKVQKEKQKTKKQKAKDKKKEYNKRKKAREKELKAKRKARKKGRKPAPKKKTETKPVETTAPVVTTPKEEEPKAEKAADKEDDFDLSAQKDKPFKHRSAYQEGQLWLARTYIERDKYEQANYLIRALEENKYLYEDVRRDLAAVKAYRFLKQKRYDEVLSPLERAREMAQGRNTKARYSYILAQINQDMGNSQAAYRHFEEVVKLKPQYEMEFSARLSMNLNKYKTGSASTDVAIKSLEKMLKDEKNIDFKDRIYFAMSEIYLKDGNEKEGIAYLEKALKEGGGNKAQQGEAYLKLARLYYEDENYVKAKEYFDSALRTLAKNDDRYDDVKELSTSLTDIAKNLQLITLQDSLLGISAMTNDEKRAIAAEIKRKQDEERRQQAIQSAQNANNTNRLAPTSAVQGARSGNSRSTPSTFFAYDDRIVKRGKRDFQREWGTRVLEDDWRRSNRQSTSDTDIAEEDNSNGWLTDEQVATILKDVPQSQKQVEGAKNTMMTALFELGVLYRERLVKHEKAVAAFEDLITRFPDTRYKPEALYHMYLSLQELGQTAKAQTVLEQLVNEFPDSVYAKILGDPNYAAQLNSKEQQLNQFYDATYAFFEAGKYPEAQTNITQVNQRFGPNNALESRFALLNAMVAGSLKGKDTYVKELKDIVAKYPKTPEQKRAREILRLLGAASTNSLAGGDDDGSSRFKYTPDKLHYIIIALEPGTKISDLKVQVSNYNRKYHSSDRLRVSNVYLDAGNAADQRVPLLVLRRFKTAENAMSYYEGVALNASDFIKSNFELLAVTQDSYREILRSKSIGGYKEFFEENYLD